MMDRIRDGLMDLLFSLSLPFYLSYCVKDLLASTKLDEQLFGLGLQVLYSFYTTHNAWQEALLLGDICDGLGWILGRGEKISGG